MPASAVTAEPAARPIIEVRDFRAAYAGKTVLENVSFDVHAGEVLVLAGGSGCGKSTMLRHMIGLYKPAGGHILIDGDDIATATGDDYVRILRKIGVMYQGGALFGSMTTLENVRLPLEEYTDLSDSAMDDVAISKLKLVDLEHAAQRLPSEISGGMQKRAAIARAMALDPKILFLDEPSAGLDPITSADLDTLIVTLAKLLKTTFVIVTHELPSIFSIADRVVVLDAAVKTMVAVDDPVALRDTSDNPWVRDFFNRRGAETSAHGAPEGHAGAPAGGSNGASDS